MARHLGTLKVSLKVDTEKFRKAIDNAAKSIKDFSYKINSVGKKLSAGLTVPLSALGTAAVAAGLKIDDALDDIAIGTGAVGEALKGLQADFKAIAGQVPDDMSLSAKAIADLNTMLGASGPELQKMAVDFLNVARITKSDLGSIISSTTKLMNNWGVSTSRATEMLDKLLVTSQNTGVSMDAIASGITSSGSALREMGIGLEQSMALIGQLDKAGIEAQQVIGSLQLAMRNFAKAGITDFTGAFNTLFDKIKNVSSLDKAITMANEAFGRAGVVMATAIREGRFEIDELTKSIFNSTGAVDTFTKETEGFSEKLGRLKNNFTLALEPLGTKILAIVEEYMPALTDATGKLNLDFSDTTIKIGMVVAVLGPLTLALGAVTAAISSLCTAASTLIGFLTGPVGLAVALAAIVTGIGIYARQIREANDKTLEATDAIRELTVQVRNMTMEQLRQQLFATESAMRDLTYQTHKARAAIAELEAQKAKAVADYITYNYDMGSTSLTGTEHIDSAISKERERLKNAIKLKEENQKLLDVINRQIKALEDGNKITKNPKTTETDISKLLRGRKSKKEKSGKSEAELFVEYVQGQMKYFKNSGLEFLPKIEAWEEKLKPLSDDWKKLKDLEININDTNFSKTIQTIQDKIKYTGASVEEFIPQLQNMLSGLDPLSDKGKKVADVLKELSEKLYNDKWKNFNWDFSQGFLKTTEYAELLKTEVSSLERGTEKWRSKFAELQNVLSSDISEKLKELNQSFQDGVLNNVGYENALRQIMTDFAEFPKVVQAANNALKEFQEAQAKLTPSLSKQLSSALKDVTADFNQLQGKAILGTIDGFLNAAIKGEDFGEALKKLGQDIVYTILKMLILQQVTQWLNNSFSGLGSLFGFSSGGLIPDVKPFAKGGLVNKPTIFPMSKGLGLMGEAGTEAVMPLARDNYGRLGVYAGERFSRNSAPEVIINVENKSSNNVTMERGNIDFNEQFNKAVVNVILRDQATNGPISRNYRSVMR